MHAFAGQLQHGRSTDIATRSGDQCDLPCELAHALSLLQCLHRTPKLGSDVESNFTCAKAVEHVVAHCIARIDPRALLPNSEKIDFSRPRGLPVRAQRAANLSMLQREAIVSRRGTDRWDCGGAGLRQLGREMSRPILDNVQKVSPHRHLCSLRRHAKAGEVSSHNDLSGEHPPSWAAFL